MSQETTLILDGTDPAKDPEGLRGGTQSNFVAFSKRVMC